MEWILKIMANKRRLEIVGYLKKKKQASVTDIANKIKLSFRSTSRHLNVLYGADLLTKEQKNVQVFYTLSQDMPVVVKQIINLL